MELDLNKFRTLIPLNELFEESLLFLAEHTKIERKPQASVICDIGDQGGSTIYLMSGKVLMINAEEKQTLVASGSERALNPLVSGSPRQYRVEVASDSATLACFDNHLLDRLLSWEQLSPDEPAVSQEDLTMGPNLEDSEWMMSMLQTKAFRKLPAANIQSLFEHMEQLNVKSGDVIIHMGEPGEFFYVIKEGRCRVTIPSSSGEMILAELGRCSSFGEQALISDEPRNATVTAVTSGKLMRLSKKDFLELMEEPLLSRIDYATCLKMIKSGAIPLDVRFRSEFEKNKLKNALNIPIQHLRSRTKELDPSGEYILYCNNGQRSSTAAFLLSQQGFNVHVLKGGLSPV
ncbi:MAG: hypothetical protein C0631_08595 [Sedimenticola sp.]|nr:MAG: hypothetical protein C0631_08595 [Sedimenticola sp.]